MKNRLTIAKKFDCEDGMKGNEKESSTMSQKQKDQWRSYVISKLKESCPVVDDNTSREELDEWKKESPP